MVDKAPFRPSNEVPLVSGMIVYDWTDTPIQMRHVLSPAKVVKLIRNASSVGVYCASLDGIDLAPQKTNLSASVKRMAPDTMIACTFNGLDLYIIGAVEGNGNEGTERFLSDFAAAQAGEAYDPEGNEG